MSSYGFNIHTPVYVGVNCVRDHGYVLKRYGKRAFIITSNFGAFYHYSLEDMKAVLEEQGILYQINDKVPVNPPVEAIKEIADECRTFAPDFLIAVGGGAALDAAKGVSVLLPHPDEDPYKVFWGDGISAAGRHTTMYNETTLPIIVAPTTAGTGSEVTAASVLTRQDVDTKMVIYQNVFCELAFLDPRYIQDSPRELLHTGVMDALCHAVESYLNVKSTMMTRAVGEIGMRMFSNFKDRLLSNELTLQDYQDMLVASYFDGISFQCGTSLPHGMGYPLSHHKNVLHGLSCGIYLAEYLRAFRDKTEVNRVVEMCGFEDINAFASYIQKFMDMDVQLTLTRDEIRQYAEGFWTQEAHRLKRHPEPMDFSDVLTVFEKSLHRYVKE